MTKNMMLAMKAQASSIDDMILHSGVDVKNVDIQKIIEESSLIKSDEVNGLFCRPNHVRNLVMVIDDDPSQLRSCRKLLEDHYDLLLCDRGALAIEQYRLHQNKVCSILLDLRLPDISGFDVFNQIKDINYDIPIILITGYQQTYGDGFELYKKYRPNGYIIKNHENESRMILDTLASSVALYKHLRELVLEREQDIRQTTMAGLLHDLRNLFQPISMVPQLLEAAVETNDMERLQYFLTMLTNSVELFSENQKLLFNYAIGKKLHLQLLPLDLLAAFNHFIAVALYNKEDYFDIQLNMHYEGMFFVDKTVLFYQVLYNIIKNSYEAFLSKSGFKGLITISVYNYELYQRVTGHKVIFQDKHPDDLVIVVADNGGGVPAEYEASLLEPYFTSGKASGTGLGTWMIKVGVLDLFKGDLALDNRPGDGLTYHICVPYNLTDLIADQD